jgi:hypothetical protein
LSISSGCVSNTENGIKTIPLGSEMTALKLKYQFIIQAVHKFDLLSFMIKEISNRLSYTVHLHLPY